LPTRYSVNFLINFTFFTATYLSKTQRSIFVLKVPLNPNQSVNLINQSIVNVWLDNTVIC